MNEYINKNALTERIIVREALIKEERNADYENMETYNGMIRGLVEAQRFMLETETIEIVRCKDCKYRKKGLPYCAYFGETDFCSKGERRETE